MIASAGIGDAEEEHAVDRHRHVVAGDDLLLGDVDRQHPGVDHPELVDQRDDQEQAGALDVLVLAQPEDDGPLPLRGELDRRGEDQVGEEPGEPQDHGQAGWTGASGATIATPTSSRITNTRPEM